MGRARCGLANPRRAPPRTHTPTCSSSSLARCTPSWQAKSPGFLYATNPYSTVFVHLHVLYPAYTNTTVKAQKGSAQIFLQIVLRAHHAATLWAPLPPGPQVSHRDSIQNVFFFWDLSIYYRKVEGTGACWNTGALVEQQISLVCSCSCEFWFLVYVFPAAWSLM